MKSKNLLLSTVIFLSTSLVFAQMYVGEVKVKVEESTLLFVTQNLEIDNADGTDGTSNNAGTALTGADLTQEITDNFTDIDGFVRVRGNFINGASNVVANTAANRIGLVQGANFRLNESEVDAQGNALSTSDLSAQRGGGQLWLEGTATGNAELVRTVPNSGGGFGQVAVPFSGLTGSDIATQFGASSYFFSADALPSIGRLFNLLFRFNNGSGSTIPAFDPIDSTDPIEPTDYTIVNNTRFGNLRLGMVNGQKISPEGIPYTGAGTITFTEIDDFDYNTAVSIYNEPATTYISDISQDCTGATSSECGRYQYQFANPYLTNLDFTNIINDLGSVDNGIGPSNDNGGVTHIGVITNGTYDPMLGSSNDNLEVAAFTNAGVGADNQALIVAPLSPFIIKLNNTVGSTPVTVDLANYRSFNAQGNQGNSPDPIAAQGNGSGNFLGEPSLYEIGLQIFESSNLIDKMGRFYVAASNFTQTAVLSSAEVSHNNGSPMYTVQEELDGSISENPMGMYSNIVNVDFKGKKIPVTFEPVEGINEYTLKFFKRNELNNGDRRILEQGDVFSTGEAFHFYDLENGNQAIEIDNDFEYTFSVNSSEVISDRFYIVYGERSNLNTVEVSKVGLTKVFKIDNNDYAIRFNEDELGAFANVIIYNSLGQLVSNLKNLDTSVDYKLPLGEDASLYVIKIEGENGTVINRKVVK